MRRVAAAVAGAALVLGLGSAGWAQQATNETGEKQIILGPSTNSYGRLLLALPAGAESEVQYQPDNNALSVKTIKGEARITTSARYLILVESIGGSVEIRMANGRVIRVEPGQSEIVGAAIVDDPGQTIIRLNGSGPFVAQAGGGGGASTEVRATVLIGTPAASVVGTGFTPGPVVGTPTSSSAFTP
jgi:hypothetical protein